MSVAAREAHASAQRLILTGILLMAAATQLQPMMDAITKYLGGQISPLQVAWSRLFFQMVFTLPFVIAAQGLAGLLPRPVGLQMLRGVFLCATNVAFTFGIVLMPLADAIALIFIAPLVVTMLSALVLGETVGPRRWAAVAVGLLGAVIVVRPGSGVFGLAALLPLTAAIFYASYLIVTRRLSGSSRPMQMHFFTALVGTIILAIPLAIGWSFEIGFLAPVLPTSIQWGLLVAIGLLSTVSHLFIILAYSRAPASVLAPITYLEIVGATVIGYIVFADFPDSWTIAGVAVIITSGLYVLLRERAQGGIASALYNIRARRP